MAFWVYILKCSDGRYYTGHTDNLESRIAQHHSGGFCEFTSRRRPVQFLWSQEFSSRIEALEAERRIKPWSQAKKEALIAGDWDALSYFAKPPRERPSTSLGTNGFHGEVVLHSSFVSRAIGTPLEQPNDPFVSSEVETRSTPGKHP